jgi:hypothetical protein
MLGGAQINWGVVLCIRVLSYFFELLLPAVWILLKLLNKFSQYFSPFKLFFLLFKLNGLTSKPLLEV